MEYVEECRKVVDHCFSAYEPLTVAVGITAEEFSLYSKWVVERAQDALQLSAIAVAFDDASRDPATLGSSDSQGAIPDNNNAPYPLPTPCKGRVVGFAICFRDSTDPPEVGTECHPKDAANEYLLAELERVAMSNPANSDLKQLGASQRAKMTLLGCLPEFGRGGLALRLVDWCVHRAREYGLDAVVAEATNPRSRRVFEKANFSLRAEVPLQSFEFRGARPFSTVTASNAISLLIKDLRCAPQSPNHGACPDLRDQNRTNAVISTNAGRGGSKSTRTKHPTDKPRAKLHSNQTLLDVDSPFAPASPAVRRFLSSPLVLLLFVVALVTHGLLLNLAVSAPSALM